MPAWLCTQNGAEKRSRILTTSVIWSFCVCCVRFCANYNNNKNWVTSGSNYITKKPLVIFGFCRDFLVVCTGTAQMISCQKVIFTNSSFPHSHIILKGSPENSQIWALSNVNCLVFDQGFGGNTTRNWSYGHLGGQFSNQLEAKSRTVEGFFFQRITLLANGLLILVHQHITTFVKEVSKKVVLFEYSPKHRNLRWNFVLSSYGQINCWQGSSSSYPCAGKS